MTTFNTDTFATIGTVMREHAGIMESRKGENETIQQEKVEQYARLTSEVWQFPTAKGKLSKTNREAVMAALAKHADIDGERGKGKRLYDGAVALSHKRKTLLKHGDQSPPASVTAEWIAARLIEQGLTSEGKLRAALFPNASADAVEKVVRQFVGSYTYAKDDDGERQVNNIREGNNADEFDALIDALKDRKRIFDEVRAAAQNGVSEAESLAKMLESID